MENKKKEKFKLTTEDKLIFSLSVLIIVYFYYGFYIGENSAGAGGYNGDFKLIWSNLILLKQDIVSNLDNPNYNDSRPPLSYILHIFFNPFIDTKENFRISNLIISSIIPFLLFFSIKKKFKNLSNNLIFFLSVIVTLSPYFRTTSYWALGENYGIIFLLLSYLTYKKIEENKEFFSNPQLNLMIFFLCLLSSSVVYFDQKLVFIPFLVFYLIINLKIELNFKIIAVFQFIIFSLPYFYLIYIWQGLIPPSANELRGVGSQIHLFNPGYCLTILSIALFPFIFLKKINFKNIDLKINADTVKVLCIFLIYLTIIMIFGDFENLRIEGKGAFHKISLFLIDNTNLRLIATLIVFFISLIIVFIVLEKKDDLIIVSYFIILSLFTFPFYQEYLDPLLYILIFSFFKSNFNFNSKMIFLIFCYYFIFSLSSKYYYQLTI